MAKGKIISITGDEIEFLIPSSRNGFHSTKFNRSLGSWSCTCEWYGYRGGYCRHMKEAKELLDSLNGEVQGSDSTVKRVIWEQVMGEVQE